jgi:hypothetical protein
LLATSVSRRPNRSPTYPVGISPTTNSGE